MSLIQLSSEISLSKQGLYQTLESRSDFQISGIFEARELAHFRMVTFYIPNSFEIEVSETRRCAFNDLYHPCQVSLVQDNIYAYLLPT